MSHPVEDLIIVGGVIDTLWPWSSPSVTVHMDWNSLGFSLEGHHIEQFLLIEDSIKDIEKIQEQMESMMHNKVNIERLQKDVEKLMNDLEKLKDKVRDNGNHS